MCGGVFDRCIPGSGLTVCGLYLNGIGIFVSLVISIMVLMSGVAMTVVGYTDLNSESFYGLSSDENNYFTNGNDQNPLRIVGPIVMLLGAFSSLALGVIYALACMADDTHYRTTRKRPDYADYVPADKPMKTKVHQDLRKEDIHPVQATPPANEEGGKKSPSTSSEESNFKEPISGSGTASSSSKSTPPPVTGYPSQYAPRPGEGLRSTGV